MNELSPRAEVDLIIKELNDTLNSIYKAAEDYSDAYNLANNEQNTLYKINFDDLKSRIK